jgi:hypothetical protein
VIQQPLRVRRVRLAPLLRRRLRDAARRIASLGRAQRLFGDVERWVPAERREAVVSQLLQGERWLLWALDHEDASVQRAGIAAAKPPLSPAVRERLAALRVDDPTVTAQITITLFKDDPAAFVDRVFALLAGPPPRPLGVLMAAPPSVRDPALLRILDDPTLAHLHVDAAVAARHSGSPTYQAHRERFDALLRPTWVVVP